MKTTEIPKAIHLTQDQTVKEGLNRALGILMLPPPEQPTHIESALVVPTRHPSPPPQNIFPEALHVFDGSEGLYVPFVYAMFTLATAHRVDLARIADDVQTQFPDHEVLTHPDAGNDLFFQIYMREHMPRAASTQTSQSALAQMAAEVEAYLDGGF